MKKNYVEKARTIASFVKKNEHLFKESSNELAQFLYEELSKRKNYANYTYRIDNVEIQFFINPTDGDGRNGGYLCCNVKNIDTDDMAMIFTSCENTIEYWYPNLYTVYSPDIIGIKDEGKFLFDWDKIIECMEECINDME